MIAVNPQSRCNKDVVRIATYRRAATPKPASDSSSLENQNHDLIGYIAGKAGNNWITKPEWDFAERASGLEKNRPELEKLLALVKRKAVDIVLVKRIDRLARSHKLLNEIFEWFRQHRVGLVATEEGFDTQNVWSGIGKRPIFSKLTQV